MFSLRARGCSSFYLLWLRGPEYSGSDDEGEVRAPKVNEELADFYNEPPPDVAAVVALAQRDKRSADGNEVQDSQETRTDHEEPEAKEISSSSDPESIEAPEEGDDGEDDAVATTVEEGGDESDDGEYNNKETQLLKVASITCTPLQGETRI
jgi:hypothetical protein